ncbi:MAG: hypothetical protein Q9160_007751 [Pyrenula sp. 1 TL-2023]
MDTDTLMKRIKAWRSEPSLAQTMSKEVNELLARDGQRPPRAFPGAQPVSFSARHLHELTLKDYYVCEKTDGIRYLLYMTQGNIGEDAAYLIDRKNDYYFVPGCHFPVPEDPTFAKFHLETILDGELVCDTYPGGHSEIKFLVFDCLIVDGKSMLNRTLDKRLAYFQELVLKPYKTMYAKWPEETKHRPFAMEDKNTELSYGVEKMFREVIPKVKRVHGNDGLIFTCRSTGYRMGTDEHILKWKPPQENTIDFVLRIIWQQYDPEPTDPDQSPIIEYQALPQRFELWAYAGGRDDEHRFFSELHVTEPEWESLKEMGKPLQDSVVECYMEQPDPSAQAGENKTVPTTPRWKFHRLRDDKLNANHVSVVDKVLESIQDAVGEEDLIRVAGRVREAWKRRHAAEEEEAIRRKHQAAQAHPQRHAPPGGQERRGSEMLAAAPRPGGGEEGP